MGKTYRIAWRTLRFLGRPLCFWSIVIVLLFANGMHGRPTDALPAIVLWLFAFGALSGLARILPQPTATPILPTDKPLPKPQLAVSVTPEAPAAGCPDRDTMVGALSPTLRGLLC